MINDAPEYPRPSASVVGVLKLVLPLLKQADNYSPHLTTKRCRRVTDWAEANNVEIAYTRPTLHG